MSGVPAVSHYAAGVVPTAHIFAAVPAELYGSLQPAPLQHHCIAEGGAPFQGMNTKMYDTDLTFLFCGTLTLQEQEACE